jgi:hypothetical protein
MLTHQAGGAVGVADAIRGAERRSAYVIRQQPSATVSIRQQNLMRAPLAPPRRSVARNVAADAHAVRTSWLIDTPD